VETRTVPTIEIIERFLKEHGWEQNPDNDVWEAPKATGFRPGSPEGRIDKYALYSGKVRIPGLEGGLANGDTP
jgi:hypothetical protein